MNKKKRKKPYAQHQEYRFALPVQFMLICRLLQVEPRKVLYQFMCNLAHESYATGTDQKIAARKRAFRQLFYFFSDDGCVFRRCKLVGAVRLGETVPWTPKSPQSEFV